MAIYDVIITHKDDTISVSEDIEAKDERDAFNKVCKIWSDKPPAKVVKFSKKQGDSK